MNTAMTAHEGKMWNMIGAIGWIESGHDSDGCEKRLYELHDNDSIAELGEFANNLHILLAGTVEAFEVRTGMRCGSYMVNDDWTVMINHVIGMGKLTFDAVMSDPLVLNRIDHEEDFGYVLPLSADAVPYIRSRIN